MFLTCNNLSASRRSRKLEDGKAPKEVPNVPSKKIITVRIWSGTQISFILKRGLWRASKLNLEPSIATVLSAPQICPPKLTWSRCDIYYFLPPKVIKPWMCYCQRHSKSFCDGSGKRGKENPAAHLCTHANPSSKSAHCSLSRIRPSCSKDSPSDGAEEVCDCGCVCVCVWWIPGKNAVAFDHFNHFLLYL